MTRQVTSMPTVSTLVNKNVPTRQNTSFSEALTPICKRSNWLKKIYNNKSIHSVTILQFYITALNQKCFKTTGTRGGWWSSVSHLPATTMVLVWDVTGYDLWLQKITNGWVGRLNDCWCWDDKPRQLRHFIICSLSNCEAATKILGCHIQLLQCASFHHCGHNGGEKRSQLCHSILRFDHFCNGTFNQNWWSVGGTFWQWDQCCTS